MTGKWKGWKGIVVAGTYFVSLLASSMSSHTFRFVCELMRAPVPFEAVLRAEERHFNALFQACRTLQTGSFVLATFAIAYPRAVDHVALMLHVHVLCTAGRSYILVRMFTRSLAIAPCRG